MKVRCVAAQCLQQGLDDLLSSLVPLCQKTEVQKTLSVLELSRSMSGSAVKDESISMAFRESLLKEWGDGIRIPDEADEATSRLALLHGSDVFFLAQEAGATKCYLRLLSALNTFGDVSDSTVQDSLIDLMMEVLDKFLASEAADGHLVDSWRSVIDGQAKMALYCATFAGVVVDCLHTIQRSDFGTYKHLFYPRLVELVGVRSSEIRKLVQEILATQVAQLVGVPVVIQLPP